MSLFFDSGRRAADAAKPKDTRHLDRIIDEYESPYHPLLVTGERSMQ